MIDIYKPMKPLRSGSQCMPVVPKIRTKGRKFPYAATTLWNDLYNIDLKRMDRRSLLSRVD